MAIKRGKKIIDKKFQLITTFKILGITFIAFLSIIAVLSISAVINNKNLNKTIIELNDVITSEKNIINTFIDYSKMIENNGLILQTNKLSDTHEKSINKIKTHINHLNILITRDIQLLIIIIGIIIAFGICLYFYLLTFTHRISGPAFVMKKYMEEIIEGNIPQSRKLRDKDELKEVYEKLITLVEKYNKK